MGGGAVACGALTATPSGGIAGTGVASAVLGVFAWDLGVTVVRRSRSGVALFAGDRSHMYDQLIDRGWSVAAS